MTWLEWVLAAALVARCTVGIQRILLLFLLAVAACVLLLN